MNLSRDQEDAMWRCSSNGDYKSFKETGSSFVRIERGECRNIPVRIFCARVGNGIIMQPFPAADGVCVGDAVKRVLPEFGGKIVVQGVVLPGNAELYWVWKVMAHPDNFLYVTLVE